MSLIINSPVRINAAILTLLVILTACTGGNRPSYEQRVAAYDAKVRAELAQYPQEIFSPEGFRERYAGATSLSFNKQHGTQIMYMAADGKVYLWYPGNKSALAGDWIVRPIRTRPEFSEVCFRYGRNTYNPATRQRGGQFSCRSTRPFILSEKEYTLGDPFQLSSGQIPFVMQKNRQYSIPKIGRGLRIKVPLYK